MKSDLSEWLTEREAAAALAPMSVKTLLRRVEQGKIEMRKRERSGRKPENVFNPADIERLKPAPYVLPASEPEVMNDREPANVAMVAPPPQANAFAQFIETISTLVETKRTDGEKRFLTLKEASRCGLSKRYLRRAVEEGRLPFVQDGRQIKIAREELAKL